MRKALSSRSATFPQVRYDAGLRFFHSSIRHFEIEDDLTVIYTVRMRWHTNVYRCIVSVTLSFGIRKKLPSNRCHNFIIGYPGVFLRGVKNAPSWRWWYPTRTRRGQHPTLTRTFRILSRYPRLCGRFHHFCSGFMPCPIFFYFNLRFHIYVFPPLEIQARPKLWFNEPYTVQATDTQNHPSISSWREHCSVPRNRMVLNTPNVGYETMVPLVLGARGHMYLTRISNAIIHQRKAACVLEAWAHGTDNALHLYRIRDEHSVAEHRFRANFPKGTLGDDIGQGACRFYSSWSVGCQEEKHSLVQ